MDLDQFNSDRDALEQLIRTQIKSFVEKYQVYDIRVAIAPKHMVATTRIAKLVDVNVKIKVDI